MRLTSFRVTNYRSIIDSKECYLSHTDGITILAGQNESGKSSLLEALKHYQNGTACIDAYRDEEDLSVTPKVSCTYTMQEDENLYDIMIGMSWKQTELNDLLTREEFAKYLREVKGFRISRSIGNTKTTYNTVLEFDQKLTDAFKIIKTTEEYKNTTELKIRIWLSAALLFVAPKIILFDDFFNILPDRFYLDELTDTSEEKGLQAVRNVESILGVDFSELEDFSDNKVTRKQEEFKTTLTANFNERWRQRIGDEAGATISVTYHQGGKDGRAYLRFFIQTRAGELLPPQKRSL